VISRGVPLIGGKGTMARKPPTIRGKKAQEKEENFVVLERFKKASVRRY